MNIEQLKTEWRQYDQKLTLSARLSEQLVLSMLKERSRSRVARIRRANLTYLAVLIIDLIVLAGIFAGNPFDFQYAWQYIPYGLLTAGLVLVMFSLSKSLRTLHLHFNHASLDTFLRKTIAEYGKSKKNQVLCRIITFTGGALTILSFLPPMIENKGLWPALGLAGIILAVTLLLYLAAHKSGVFKSSNKEAFENDLAELGELKQVAAELGGR